MSLSREEQLELVARNIGEWPDASVELWAYFYGGVFLTDKQSNDCYKRHMTHTNPPEYFFTHSEVEAKRREITGEPDDSDAPEWAVWRCQERDGRWFWLNKKPIAASYDIGVFVGLSRREEAGRGEVLEDWRDTLKKINREKKEVSEVEKVEFKNGDKVLVEVNDTSYEADYIGRMSTNDKDHVCYNPMFGVRVFVESNIKPLPSERDEFAGVFLKLIGDAFYGSRNNTPVELLPDDDAKFYGGVIFDAIKDGKLKVPEVKDD